MLRTQSAFYAEVGGPKGILGPKLSQSEVDGCAAILKAFDGQPLAFAAYGLATAYHETAHTMEPVEERGGKSYFFRMYDKAGARPEVAKRLGNIYPGDGAIFYGRGYPQHTGRRNYELAAKLFGIPFDKDPDLMLLSANAAKVMVRFMVDGLYTGKKLGDFLPASGPADAHQFHQARRVVNGLDRAEDIAAYAGRFQTALIEGEWK